MNETLPAFSPPLRFLAAFFRFDVVTVTMLGLILFVGLIILRFSRVYLAGDGGLTRYRRWLLTTLAAVTVLVVSNHLLLLACAWVATSLSLHQLLTFYPERRPALIAAHKKFLVSRVGDACMFGAIGLIGLEVGSFNIDKVDLWAESVESLPVGMQVATVLLVIGACMKCAQLPFHGWLIQVMEAPTPVSALLHAGVVNIGGFLMIRLAPLMVRSEIAQTLLVVMGCTTAIVAALVMTTRVSIKVALAWSTCAQMGFMLVQCGLGAYQLALLHIVAHSLYKAHAFLTSGSTVEVWRRETIAAPRQPSGFGRWIAAAMVAIVGVTAVATAFGANPADEPALWALALILSLSLVPLLVRGGGDWRRLAAVAFGSISVTALYFTWHAIFRAVLKTPTFTESMPIRLAIVIVGFGALFFVQAVMYGNPEGRLARALYPRLFAGLYLDDVFTRLTFRVWPPKLPRPDRHEPSFRVAKTLES